MPNPPEATQTRSTQPARVTTIEDVTCTACGCLCDDLTLSVADGRIVEARLACEVGRRWFLADRSKQAVDVARVEGQAVGRDQALDRAAEILERAKNPVIIGLTRTTTETAAAAVALADRLGGAVEIGSSDAAVPGLLAMQRVGRVSATLGEVKNRADVVVFWGVDPLATHPRHWERYSVEPHGRFVPEGRAGRTVIVADTEETATARHADLFLKVVTDAQFETLWALRALVLGVELDAARVARSTGLELAMLRDCAEQLKRARYGAWFYGEELGKARGGAINVEAALLLVRDLNAQRRFVILTMGGPGNPSGAAATLTWQTGFAASVSLARGVPRSLPTETSALTMLERGEADIALIVGEDGAAGLSDLARTALARIPRIVIAPDATAQEQSATVALASATPGIDASGTMTRVDGVVLRLRPALTASLPTDLEWLLAIENRVKDRQRRT